MTEIAVQRLGWMVYKSAWEYQDGLFQSIIHSKLTNGTYTGKSYLLLVEHPSVYTIGKAGNKEHFLNEKDQQVQLYQSNRGGDITYHGPGQLVAYPILDLEQYFTDLKKYMRSLEQVVIDVLGDYGIEAGRLKGATGVWLDPEHNHLSRKICAMGVKTSRWVTMHGLALNVNTDLTYFDQIIPCGIRDRGVTSIEKELGKPIPMNEVEDRLIHHFGEIFGATMTEEKC